MLEPPPVRRTVRLDLPVDDQPPPAPRVRSWRRPKRPKRSLALIAERLVGDWAPTLRQSIVLVVMLAVLLVCVAVTFGVAGVLVGLGLCALIRLVPGLRHHD